MRLKNNLHSYLIHLHIRNTTLLYYVHRLSIYIDCASFDEFDAFNIALLTFELYSNHEEASEPFA